MNKIKNGLSKKDGIAYIGKMQNVFLRMLTSPER